MMLTRREFIGAAAAAAAASVAGSAFAQTFPSRPLRLVVPFTAGGAGDVQARVVGERMARALGQPVVVENKPGASTIIGSAQVAQAPADGHTLLLISNSFVINAKLRGDSLPYRGMKAFEPVACLTNSPQLIAVNSASAWHSFKDWMDAAKAKPGTISYATVGPATGVHVASEMLVRKAGVRMVYVPFPGGAPAVGAALGGHVDTVIAHLSELKSFLEAGKLRALATLTPQRLPSLPEVPTIAEVGLEGAEVPAWFGLVAPAGTPADVVARIAGAAKDALADTEVRERLVTLSLEPYEMGPAQFALYLDKEYAEYSKVIDEAGIKV